MFGNSVGDCSMHNYALSSPQSSAAFMLIADDRYDQLIPEKDIGACLRLDIPHPHLLFPLPLGLSLPFPLWHRHNP